MDATEDDDIRLQKAAGGLVSELRSLLDIILWKPADPAKGKRKVHSRIRARDLGRAIALVP